MFEEARSRFQEKGIYNLLDKLGKWVKNCIRELKVSLTNRFF
jgi:hypothetical protein